MLVTGAVRYIGMHVTKLPLERGDEVVGIDNLNDYYDPNLRLARLDHLPPLPRFKLMQRDIADRMTMEELFASEKPNRVVNLAAQAGVRHSLIHRIHTSRLIRSDSRTSSKAVGTTASSI